MHNSLAQHEDIQLQNTSSEPQIIIDVDGDFGDKGRRYELQAGFIGYVEANLADRFLTDRPRWIQEYEEQPIPPVPGEPEVWVANCTGNPFLPAEIKVSRVTKGAQDDYTIANPLRTPIMVKRPIRGGQEKVQTPDGSDYQMINKPGFTFKFPPYSRRRMALRYGKWNEERDLRQMENRRGSVKMCPAPTSFEPSVRWTLADMQSWCRLVAPQKFVDEPLASLLVPHKKDELTVTEDADMRRELFSAIFFLLIDEQQHTPNREEFNAFVELERVNPTKKPKVVTPAPKPRKRGDGGITVDVVE